MEIYRHRRRRGSLFGGYVAVSRHDCDGGGGGGGGGGMSEDDRKRRENNWRRASQFQRKPNAFESSDHRDYGKEGGVKAKDLAEQAIRTA